MTRTGSKESEGRTSMLRNESEPKGRFSGFLGYPNGAFERREGCILHQSLSRTYQILANITSLSGSRFLGQEGNSSAAGKNENRYLHGKNDSQCSILKLPFLLGLSSRYDGFI
jgi:hypothetical protein